MDLRPAVVRPRFFAFDDASAGLAGVLSVPSAFALAQASLCVWVDLTAASSDIPSTSPPQPARNASASVTPASRADVVIFDKCMGHLPFPSRHGDARSPAQRRESAPVDSKSNKHTHSHASRIARREAAGTTNDRGHATGARRVHSPRRGSTHPH